MALTPASPEGATALDPDEAEGLLPGHIETRAELNEWEQQNIIDGERWAFARKRPRLLTVDFMLELHRQMFRQTWRWAGRIRQSEKNLGIEPARIEPELKTLCLDIEAQLRDGGCKLDEIAARFHHRLASIHPFSNGNGRFSRTMADLLLVREDGKRFTWGGGDLVAPGPVRDRYLDALRAADKKDYRALLEFVRS